MNATQSARENSNQATFVTEPPTPPPPPTHVVLTGSRRAPPQHAVRIRDVDPHADIEVTVTLKGPDLPSPENMPTQALSREEIDRRWGVPAATVQKVQQVLRSFGLQIHDVKQGGRSLRVAGSAAAMVAAFQPKLGIYQVQGQGEIRGREGPLMVPRELDGLITGVDGLDQRRMAHGHAQAKATKRRGATRTAKRHAAAEVPAAAAAGLMAQTPADLQQRYNFPPGDCAGETIFIAEFGLKSDSTGKIVPPAYIPSDVIAFCTAHGVPAPTVKLQPVNIAPLNQQQYETHLRQQPQDADLLKDITAETMMDVQIIAALCPAANISVYFVSWDQKGWVDLLDEMTSGHPTVPVAISISYGLAEEDTGWTNDAMTSINHRLQIAAMMGITVCVSSGDDGTYCGQAGNLCHVEFPTASPFVLSVGGTMLTNDSGGAIDEVVWWQTPGWRTQTGGGAPGGGVSSLKLINPRPSWQTVEVPSLNPAAPDGRVVPDVTALAGPPWYDLLLDGQSYPDGGTSAATPLWASLIARINAALPAAKRQRFLPPLLYKATVAQNGFRRIVSGNNASYPNPGKGYVASQEFNAVSGWGAPDGVKLLNALEQV
jgi:kumamolisin